MLKKFLSFVCVAVAFCVSAMAQSNAEPLILKAGTPVTMVAAQRISSNSVTMGSSVNFMVNNDVLAQGTVVIPAGTLVNGTVYDVSHSTVLGIPGRLGISIDGVYASDGTYVPITGATIYSEGDNNMALAIICGLFTVVGFIISGEAAVIQSGTPVQGMVMVNTAIYGGSAI